MKMTAAESATRHMTAGVEDLDELARLVEQDTGRVPSIKVLRNSRSYFRKHGPAWLDVEREKTAKRNRRWMTENAAKHRETCRRWDVENPAKKLLNTCRRNAKVRGHECTITVEVIAAMLAPMTCSATGLPLTWEHLGGSKANPWAPSIDRLDCSRGYVSGNVRVVCWAFNQMRGDFPDEAVFALAKAVAARAPDLLSARRRL